MLVILFVDLDPIGNFLVTAQRADRLRNHRAVLGERVFHRKAKAAETLQRVIDYVLSDDGHGIGPFSSDYQCQPRAGTHGSDRRLYLLDAPDRDIKNKEGGTRS